MSIEIKKFVRKPIYVDGVQVTEQNMREVAKWCEGRVRQTKGKKPAEKFIQVEVTRPQTPRQTKAFVGDWVLKAPAGYKVYTEQALAKSFDPLEGEELDKANQAEKLQPVKRPDLPEPSSLNDGDLHVFYRSAVNGEYISEEQAAEDPDHTIKETVTANKEGDVVNILHQARDAKTGHWVTVEFADVNPKTTVVENN